jgi:signal transduction histidine kinase
MEERAFVNTIQLSSLLADRRVEILERWTQRIRWEHPDKDLSRGELWDQLPHFFDEVLGALHAPRGSKGGDTVADADTASVEHGTQRLRVGFDLAEVIREYEILTECILDEVNAVEGAISIEQLRRVLRLVNAGRVDAVSAYVERRGEDIARAHSQHVSFVAHELRGPLMTALMAVQELRQSVPQEHEWALGMLSRSLVSLRDLINKVLTTERLDGRVQLTREALDLRVLLDQVVTENRLSAEQRRIKLIVRAADALPCSGDRRLLRSAFENVLGNSIKFTQEGSTVIVTGQLREGAIVIEVEDACGGLPDGDTAALFKPFVQRGEDRTGFGLGLAIVKQAIEVHGGRVTVKNLPSKGCVFSLELPPTAT